LGYLIFVCLFYSFVHTALDIMKIEITKKELRVLHAFINGNDNPEIAGINATIFDTRRNLIKYIEPLRQKINNKIMEKK